MMKNEVFKINYDNSGVCYFGTGSNFVRCAILTLPFYAEIYY
jgi:hypothetical protein